MNPYAYEEQVARLAKQSIELIKQQSYEKSLTLLKQALVIVKKVQTEPEKSKLLAQIFNTLGNLFKKTLNYSESIKFYQKALNLEPNLKDNDKGYIALAYLNLSTLYSQATDHMKSIKFGSSAIALLKKLIKFSPRLQNSLIIAYYNVGNEYKAISQTENSEKLLRAALNLSRDYLGPNNELTQTITNALKSLVSPALKKTQKFMRKSFNESDTKLPFINNKRSSSDDREYYKKFITGREEFNNLTYYKEGRKRNPFKTPLSDEEGSIKTDQSLTGNTWFKKFDVGRHKETEKSAAVCIQSWWRGVVNRRKVEELKVELELKQAQDKAKKAIEEYEKVKFKANKIKKQGKK